MKKWYGSIINRLEENQKDIPEIIEGMGVTEYLYSDRNAYEVTKVVNQKDVFIRRLDHKHIGNEWYDNNWELYSNPDFKEIEVVFRYGNWYEKLVYTKELMEKMEKEDGCVWLSKDIVKDIEEKGKAIRYNKMNKLRFGKAEYYYDYEF